MHANNVERWHELLNSRDVTRLDDLIADDAVFHSPIVHTPQKGKELTQLYLTAAYHVLLDSNFRYVREVVSGDDAVFEFTADIDGIHVNGVDIITCDDDGLITEFKVMMRPLQAINAVHAQMKAMLEKLSS